MARQNGMDATQQLDFYMFLDADDMFYPRAVEILYHEIQAGDYDVIASDIMHEVRNGISNIMPVDSTPCTWCFTAGTPILTETGYRPIEELKIGDLVYTKDGSLQPIEAVMSHKASNIVQTKVSGALSVTCTDDHKFYTYKGKELTAVALKDARIDTQFALATLPKGRKIHVDPALAYIIGRYVGDGWKTARKANLKSGPKEYYSYFLCSSVEEREYLHQKLVDAGIHFGYHMRKDRPHPEYTLHKCNTELIKYIDDCGRRATDKHFPTEFLKWDDESLQALFEGYFESDGCTVRVEGREPQHKIITVSPRLAQETALLLRTFGHQPTYGIKRLKGTKQTIMGNVCNRNDEYTVYWTDKPVQRYVHNDGDICYTMAMETTPAADDIVYNITVANNHSYIAGDFIVSNCHGKIYRAAYLRNNDIRFLPEFRLNEDAYFNLVAFNCGKSGMVKEPMYLWRDNPNSLTRKISNREFYRQTYAQYILTQIKGLKKMYAIKGELPFGSACGTIVNIYKMMMREVYEDGQDKSYMEDLLSLRTFKPVQDLIDNGEFWTTVIGMLPAAERTENSIFFYTQRFVDWVNEYLRPEGDQIVSLEGTEASDANSNS